MRSHRGRRLLGGDLAARGPAVARLVSIGDGASPAGGGGMIDDDGDGGGGGEEVRARRPARRASLTSAVESGDLVSPVQSLTIFDQS